MGDGIDQVPEAGVAVQDIIQRGGLHAQVLPGRGARWSGGSEAGLALVTLPQPLPGLFLKVVTSPSTTHGRAELLPTGGARQARASQLGTGAALGETQATHPTRGASDTLKRPRGTQQVVLLGHRKKSLGGRATHRAWVV